MLHHERNLHSNWHRRKNVYVAQQLKRHTMKDVTLKKKLDKFSRDVRACAAIVIVLQMAHNWCGRRFENVLEWNGGCCSQAFWIEPSLATRTLWPRRQGGTKRSLKPSAIAHQPTCMLSVLCCLPRARLTALACTIAAATTMLVLSCVAGSPMRMRLIAPWCTGQIFHGHRAGARYFFDLEPDECLVAVEGVVAHLVGRVRFYTNKGRMSSWFGRGKSGAHFFAGTLAEYKRKVAERTRKEKQRRRTASHARSDDSVATKEDEDPYLPFQLENESEEIIGFVGKTSATSLTCLGAVNRRTYHMELLARCWIPVSAGCCWMRRSQSQPHAWCCVLMQPNTDDVVTQARHQAAAEEQFASVLRMRSCDVQVAVGRITKLATFMVSHVAGLLPDPDGEIAEYQGMGGRGGGRVSVNSIVRSPNSRQVRYTTSTSNPRRPI